MCYTGGMITMTYDYKLKLSKSQVQMIETYLEVCRKVYNYALKERKDWVNSRKSPVNVCSIHSEYIISPETQRPAYNSQCKALTEAKKTYPELNVPHSQVLQQALRTLEAAFVNMWERGFGFPRFKKKQLIYQLAVNIPDVPIHGHPLGVDIGLDCYLATSDGELVKRPL